MLVLILYLRVKCGFLLRLSHSSEHGPRNRRKFPESGNTNTELLRKLSAAVNGHAVTATFACGGLAELTGTSKDGGPPGVIIRWDAGDNRDYHKVRFPCSHHDGGALEALVQHCQPATFGLGNRDVLDEGYRKAGKLDETAFSTNFHPHDYGIVDAVRQILMPSAVGGARRDDREPCGIRAELYKLNIYSAPSGKFLTHVDTPRGLTQFGSLVVCLPCAHEGGCIGFFRHHAYAHSTEAGRKLIPDAFKGVDLAIYSAFASLGLDVGVHPILHRKTSVTWHDDVESGWGGMSAKELLRGPSPGCEIQGDFVEDWLGHAPPTCPQVPRNARGYDSDDEELDDDQSSKSYMVIRFENYSK
ncbi:MAG: hypothetical protein Q9213_001428 [Squamulea squamosa]